MKIKRTPIRIALLVFLTLFLHACSSSNTSQSEMLPASSQTSTAIPSNTPQPIPTDTPGPTLSPTPEITWRNLGLVNSYIHSLVIDPLNPLILYAGGNDVILKSLDGGESWAKARIFSAVSPDHVSELVIDPLTPSTIYAAVYNQGLIKSTDDGETWQNINRGLIDFKFLALVIDPLSPNILYTGTANGVFKTTDGGENWQQVINGLPKEAIYSMTIDPQNPSTIYAGLGTGSGLYKSTDDGASWVPKNYGLFVLAGDMKVKAPTWVFAIAIDPQNPDIMYAGGHGVFKSIDGGESWFAINNEFDFTLNGPMPSIDNLSIDPVHPEIIYAEVGGSVIYRSLNGGENWSDFSEGLFLYWREGPISPIIFDPTNPEILYVGTRGNGVFTTRLTKLPTTTPTAKPEDCTNGWTQLNVNTYAVVSGDENDLPNRVRTEADLDSEIIYQLYPAEIVKLIQGPFCTDNLVFWKVENQNIPGGSGWTAEGDLNDYWLAPYSSP
ncbi:MAG: hypothetical protein JEZ00_22230 [Anaerolineaceae bacterium]|nr:hypothetical protein [Anaerolineaceae bacterium]